MLVFVVNRMLPAQGDGNLEKVPHAFTASELVNIMLPAQGDGNKSKGFSDDFILTVNIMLPAQGDGNPFYI